MLANRGAPGGDHVTIEDFGATAPEGLAALAAALRDGSYRPGRLRPVEVPKERGGTRLLRIPPVVDRVAQGAVLTLLGPWLDPLMHRDSYAYRPGRSVAQAVRRIAALRNEGFVWVAETDIDAFFDTIPHDRLLARLVPLVPDPPLLDLLALWLEAWGPGGRGVPQGAPLSPLLANWYLDPTDRAISARGIRPIRYADDLLLLARAEDRARAALIRLRASLAEDGLKLNEERTRVVPFERGFRFLGHLFVRGVVLAETAAPEEAVDQLGPLLAAMEKAQVGDADLGLADPAHNPAPGMRVLYVMEPGRELGLRHRAVTVEEAGRELLAIHVERLDRIEIGPHAGLSGAALRAIPAAGVPIALVDGRGQTLARVARPMPERAALHLAQARAALDPIVAAAMARAIVSARIHNQRALLRRLNRKRQDTEVAKACVTLNTWLRKLDHAEADVDVLRGHEGAAAAVFWPAWGRCLEHGWQFRLRRRRPAPDPVNLVLSYLAALLGRDLDLAVERAGLHPGFGVLHVSRDGAPACALDVIEPLRGPLAEACATYVFNNRVVGHTHFQPGEVEGVELASEGAKALIRAWEGWVDRRVASPFSGQNVSWRRLMAEQASAFAAAVRRAAAGEPPALVCYRMDY
ncbi:CRISPR-associated endonuclease Cas1 [Falsiroseomonas sp.]|uniref:CRISPR-associated endonuclease Cas1 n=1 Tax=Falsiroseomonas sp. TaxID=2870721 RepID=UPI003F719015